MTWAGFFFADESVRGVHAFRVLLAVWTAVMVAERLPYAGELYALPVLRIGLVTAAPPFAAVVGAMIGVFVGAGLIVAGRWPLVATAGVLVCFAWLAAVEVRLPRAYVVLALIQWFILMWAPAQRDGEAPRWVSQLLKLQFSVAYGFAGIGKLGAAGWRTGEAVAVTLRAPHYGDYLLSSWVALDVGVWPWVIAWGTIVGEIFIALGLWWPLTRRAAIVALVLLHVGIAATLRISWLFHALMLLHVVLFVRPGQGFGSGRPRAVRAAA